MHSPPANSPTCLRGCSFLGMAGTGEAESLGHEGERLGGTLVHVRVGGTEWAGDSFLALISRIEQHDEGTPAPGNHSDYHDATGQAVAAAARLAEDPGARPGSAAGTAALNTLLGTVAVAADLNAADTAAGLVPEAPAAWAAEGVLALLGRNDWAASPSAARIGAAARGLLEHDQPAVRAVGVSGLHFMTPLPAVRYARITELLQDEAADFVRARLLVQLASLLPDMPAEVDRSLAGLGSLGAWPVLAAAPQAFDAPSAEPGERPREIDFVVQILIRVALLSGHGSCKRLLAAWPDDPAAFCYRAQRVCLHLRDWLTAGNADSSRTREDAFALLTRPVAAAVRLREPRPRGTRPSAAPRASLPWSHGT